MLLSKAQELITAAPLLALYPGLMIFLDGRGLQCVAAAPRSHCRGKRADLRAADLRDKEKPPREARR